MTARMTVIVPAYRASGLIGDVIDSVMAQTEPCNLIIVDDASPDDTVAVAMARAAGNPRVQVLEQTVNQGPAAARNRAIRTCETEWVALLDADDRMAPSRMASLLALAEDHGWDFIADDLVRVQDWNAIEAGHRHWVDEDFGTLDLSLERFVRENLYNVCGHGRELGYIKPMMRLSAIREHGLFYREDMRLGEDFDLYARALIAGVRFGLVDPQGYYAFDTPGSLSKMHRGKDLKAVWQSSRALWQTPGLPAEARAALHDHMMLSHKKWAWVRLIEAKHARNPIEAAKAFMAPPPVVGELIARLREHFSGSGETVRARGEPA